MQEVPPGVLRTVITAEEKEVEKRKWLHWLIIFVLLSDLCLHDESIYYCAL